MMPDAHWEKSSIVSNSRTLLVRQWIQAPRDLSGTPCTNCFRSVSFSSLTLAKNLAYSRRSRFPFGFFQVFSTSRWSLYVCHILPRDSQGRIIGGGIEGASVCFNGVPSLVLASHGLLATVSSVLLYVIAMTMLH